VAEGDEVEEGLVELGLGRAPDDEQEESKGFPVISGEVNDDVAVVGVFLVLSAFGVVDHGGQRVGFVECFCGGSHEDG
jgi:hypothetical protein